MDELHRTTDKFERESDILIRILERVSDDKPRPDEIEIALSQAKRVRRETNLVVRVLARIRDQLQP
jgi:hypothetical protein